MATPFGTKVFSIAVLGLLCGACASLQNLESPDVVVTAIRPLDATMLEQRFAVDLRIYNPNNKELRIEGVSFDLDVNGRRLARGAGASDLLLPRLGDATTTVTVSSSVFDLARQLMAMGQAETLTYDLVGKVHLGSGFGGSLPFERSGEIGKRIQ
ncbi:MAG: LEA type 2 family protein [Gammaproteobacteria bacterium]|nr:MAG: LEA type 2 family protein [Gammaproteobacteria bacterium]